MIQTENVPFTPFYLEGAKGKLFVVYFPPVGEERGHYLYIPPFAEELNRCRSMVAAQARTLASRGYGVLLLDLYGTGDSDGEFANSQWDSWKQDVHAAHQWLTSQGKTLTGFWGVRLGCILAAEVAAELENSLSRLLFWQPILTGKTMLTQFLRIRIAAAMDLVGDKETTSEMREKLKSGELVEVGGYSLNKGLTEPIDARKLESFLSVGDTEILWLEQLKEEGGDFGVATQRLISSIKEQGGRINASGYTGPAYWQLHERSFAPELIRITTEISTA